jgi:hypothetical protein
MNPIHMYAACVQKFENDRGALSEPVVAKLREVGFMDKKLIEHNFGLIPAPRRRVNASIRRRLAEEAVDTEPQNRKRLHHAFGRVPATAATPETPMEEEGQPSEENNDATPNAFQDPDVIGMPDSDISTYQYSDNESPKRQKTTSTDEESSPKRIWDDDDFWGDAQQ